MYTLDMVSKRSKYNSFQYVTPKCIVYNGFWTFSALQKHSGDFTNIRSHTSPVISYFRTNLNRILHVFHGLPWHPKALPKSRRMPLVAKNPGHSGRVAFFNYLCKWLCGTLWVLGWTSISHQSYLPGRPKPPRFIRVSPWLKSHGETSRFISFLSTLQKWGGLACEHSKCRVMYVMVIVKVMPRADGFDL